MHQPNYPDDGYGPGRGPGLFSAAKANGQQAITNVRRIAGVPRQPGSIELAVATGLLALLAAGLFAVSLDAQYTYVLAAKHIGWTALAEAVALDIAMATCALLGLGLARRGLHARAASVMVLVFAGLSAVMNLAAADVGSPRSVLAYMMPPVVLAIVVDLLIATVRRWIIGLDTPSPWAAAGHALTRGAGTGARSLGIAGLYALRMIVAPLSTPAGARRAILAAAPVPARPQPGTALPPPASPVPAVEFRPAPALDPPAPEEVPPKRDDESQAAYLRRLYKAHPAYGDRDKMSQAATELAQRTGADRRSVWSTLDRHLAKTSQEPS